MKPGATTTKSWYRHITVSMAAAVFLVTTRDTPKKGVDDESGSGLIPLTVNEIRKLFHRIAAPIQHTVAHTLHWSHWRRTSQARARTSHYLRRGRELSLQYQ